MREREIATKPTGTAEDEQEAEGKSSSRADKLSALQLLQLEFEDAKAVLRQALDDTQTLSPTSYSVNNSQHLDEDSQDPEVVPVVKKPKQNKLGASKKGAASSSSSGGMLKSRRHSLQSEPHGISTGEATAKPRRKSSSAIEVARDATPPKKDVQMSFRKGHVEGSITTAVDQVSKCKGTRKLPRRLLSQDALPVQKRGKQALPNDSAVKPVATKLRAGKINQCSASRGASWSGASSPAKSPRSPSGMWEPDAGPDEPGRSSSPPASLSATFSGEAWPQDPAHNVQRIRQDLRLVDNQLAVAKLQAERAEHQRRLLIDQLPEPHDVSSRSRSSRSLSDLPHTSSVQPVHQAPVANEKASAIKIQAAYRGCVARHALIAQQADQAPAQIPGSVTLKRRTEARLDRMLADLDGDPTLAGRQVAQLHFGTRSTPMPAHSSTTQCSTQTPQTDEVASVSTVTPPPQRESVASTRSATSQSTSEAKVTSARLTPVHYPWLDQDQLTAPPPVQAKGIAMYPRARRAMAEAAFQQDLSAVRIKASASSAAQPCVPAETRPTRTVDNSRKVSLSSEACSHLRVSHAQPQTHTPSPWNDQRLLSDTGPRADLQPHPCPQPTTPRSSKPLLAYLPPPPAAHTSSTSRTTVTPTPKPTRTSPQSMDTTPVRTRTPPRQNASSAKPKAHSKSPVSPPERPAEAPPPPWGSSTAWTDEEGALSSPVRPRGRNSKLNVTGKTQRPEDLKISANRGGATRGPSAAECRSNSCSRLASLASSSSDEEESFRQASPPVAIPRRRPRRHQSSPPEPPPMASAAAMPSRLRQPCRRKTAPPPSPPRTVSPVVAKASAAPARAPPSRQVRMAPAVTPELASTPVSRQPTPEPMSRGTPSRAADPQGKVAKQKVNRVPKRRASAPALEVAASLQGDGLPPELPPGKVYTGFRNAKGEKEGFGVMRCKDGSIYNGQWKQNRRDGQGVLFFEGGVFDGQWLSGGAHGKGKVNFKNGDTFEGLYAENKKCGPGLYRWQDGSEEAGEYVDGLKHGWHKLTRGANQWDLLYEKGAVVLARMSGASLSPDADASTAVGADANSRATMHGSASKTRSQSPRSLVVAANATDGKRSSLQTRSKSPAVTRAPPYTRSSLKSDAPEAKRSSLKERAGAPPRTPRTSVEAKRGSNTLADFLPQSSQGNALGDDEMW